MGYWSGDFQFVRADHAESGLAGHHAELQVQWLRFESCTRDRVKKHFSVLPSQHCACLAFVCTARTDIIAHVKDPTFTFR